MFIINLNCHGKWISQMIVLTLIENKEKLQKNYFVKSKKKNIEILTI